MGAREKSRRKLNGDLLKSGDPCAKWREKPTVDVDLFLGAQNQWPEDSPHHLTILHEMFLHAASKGQKEVEQVLCQGHQWHMPQLNPEAGIPAIQLVQLETSREELLDIYLEVYKLHR